MPCGAGLTSYHPHTLHLLSLLSLDRTQTHLLAPPVEHPARKVIRRPMRLAELRVLDVVASRLLVDGEERGAERCVDGMKENVQREPGNDPDATDRVRS